MGREGKEERRKGGREERKKQKEKKRKKKLNIFLLKGTKGKSKWPFLLTFM